MMAVCFKSKKIAFSLACQCQIFFFDDIILLVSTEISVLRLEPQVQVTPLYYYTNNYLPSSILQPEYANLNDILFIKSYNNVTHQKLFSWCKKFICVISTTAVVSSLQFITLHTCWTDKYFGSTYTNTHTHTHIYSRWSATFICSAAITIALRICSCDTASYISKLVPC